MGAIKDRYFGDLKREYPTWAWSEVVDGDSTTVEAREPTHTIDSVTDSSGIARFVVTGGPALVAGSEITISGFTGSNIPYNGTWIISLVVSGDFEVDEIAWVATEASGSFIRLNERYTKPFVDDAYKSMREDLIGFAADEAKEEIISTVQTTDNTTTTIATIPITDDTTELVEATLIGIKSDGTDRATYKAIQSVYRASAGSATLIGTETVIHAVESDASWSGLSFSVSGNNLLVEAQGKNTTTIDWQCTAIIQKFT